MDRACPLYAQRPFFLPFAFLKAPRPEDAAAVPVWPLVPFLGWVPGEAAKWQTIFLGLFGYFFFPLVKNVF